MKKRISIAVLLIISGISTYGALGFQKGENQIANGSFEDDKVGEAPLGWVLQTGGWGCDLTGEYRLIADDATAHKSTKSAKIAQTNPSANASNVYAYYNDIEIEKSKTYTIAFWAKLDQSEGDKRDIDLSVQTTSIVHQMVYLKTITLDSIDWKEYTYTFISPKDVEGNSWVGLLVGLSDIDFWFDDIRFFEGGPADELKGNMTKVNASNKIISTWGRIKGSKIWRLPIMWNDPWKSPFTWALSN